MPKKITVFPDALPKATPRSMGGGARVRAPGIPAAIQELAEMRRRVGTTIISDPNQRAARIVERMRGAALATYRRAATGRFARGINAVVEVRGSPGDKVESVIRITMINYRESKFLTNLGGSGYFKDFPVPPYKIFAKGAEGLDNLANPSTGRTSRTSAKKAIAIASQHATSRLKVPRNTSFYQSHPNKRGGPERRTIRDTLGGPGKGDPKSAFFFYPLWVTHPGFEADIISDIAIEEGALYQEEILTAVTESHGDITTKALVASDSIPVALPSVFTLSRSGRASKIVLDRGTAKLFKNINK